MSKSAHNEKDDKHDKDDKQAAQEHKEHKGGHGGGHGGAHGGGGHDEAHEGAPEWLISFADNVTLMMGFFVILLALNLGPKGGGAGEKEGDRSAGATGDAAPDFMDAAVAIREAFNNPVNMNSMDPRDRELIKHMLQRRGKARANQDGPPGDEHNLQSIRPSDYFKLCGAVPFDDQSAGVTDEARAVIRDVARHLRGLRMVIDVRGHASAAEVFQLADRGMKLSFERAMAVARELAENDIDWRQMRLIACADNDRLKAVAYERSGHRSNERVDIMLTDEVMPDYAPKAAASK